MRYDCDHEPKLIVMVRRGNTDTEHRLCRRCAIKIQERLGRASVSILGESMTKPTAASDTPTSAEMDPLAGLAPGRIVHYWPTEVEERYCISGPWAAIVTAVYARLAGEETPAGTVTLNVQMPKKAPIGEDPVCRFELVPFSQDGTRGSWSWPTR